MNNNFQRNFKTAAMAPSVKQHKIIIKLLSIEGTVKL